ncbi:DEAD/DEAH box helicase [Ostreibacterium oceani]|uniref:DEAD-box ATP-dependent RNA helicase RhpA n=1 Tax=Ostreibacterium oceani TaxID=2654998 RepID=A0A6N7EUK3_9GAMM|nr:DEAD/DEAH box helicase [Ostreibacterium oceani]MPV85295.1 DEAD/DEAH box helicase [Ostreibacterium oceani]
MTNTNHGFDELGLNDAFLQALADAGYTTPSPIQTQTIPLVLAGNDILGQAQTGTGKTAAFALPTLQHIETKVNHTQVLVLAPTRELALQVAESYKTYGKYLPNIRIAPIYGGAAYGTQINALEKGAHIVVGTPGRIMDHIKRGTLKLNHLKSLVLDEADEMLRMGFIDDVEWILSKSPKQKQIALFSATMPRAIQTLSQKYLNNEVVVKVAATRETASTITQSYLAVAHKQKTQALHQLLEAEAPDAAIIFVNTKAATEELAQSLAKKNHRVAALNGDLQQKQRERVISQIKSHDIDIILATDVAARGLDVDRITHVINYDLPRDSESYTHRIGRTGRAGREGKAICILSPKDKRNLQQIQRATKTEITPYAMPSIDDINRQRMEKFTAALADKIEHAHLVPLRDMLADIDKQLDTDMLTVAAALMSLYQGKTPLLLSKRDVLAPVDLNSRDTTSHSRSADSKNPRKKRTPLAENARKVARKPRKGELAPAEMEAFTLAVGHADKVKPGHIVGAIANEAGIEGRHIGAIEIYESHTQVFLPKGMPKAIFNSLKKTHVMGKPLNISKSNAASV